MLLAFLFFFRIEDIYQSDYSLNAIAAVNKSLAYVE